jgi:hypothetical protein
VKRLALNLMLCFVAVGCGDGDGAPPDLGTDDLGVGSCGGDLGEDQVTVFVRLVDACGRDVDLYVAGETKPLLQAVAAQQVSGWVAAPLGIEHGAFELREAGAAASVRALAISDPVHPADGDRVTVIARGQGCSLQPLIDGFGAAQPGALRVRFVDTLGRDDPTRLYWEQPDGSFRQVAAVAPYGESGAEGVLVATPPPTQKSVRVQVGPELSSAVGKPGYQLPPAMLGDGAQLLVLAELLTVWIIDMDGTVAQIRINPSLAVLAAVPDICGTGTSHFAFADSDGSALATLDITFGLEKRLSLPPTASGHPITVSGAATCPSGGVQATATTAALEAGGRYLVAVYRSATDGNLRTYTTPEKLPSGVVPPAIGFFHAARGLPSLDVVRIDGGDDGGMSTLFQSIAPGTLAPWTAAPLTDYTLALAQRPTATVSFSANQSVLFLAIGDAAGAPNAPPRLVSHKLTN